MRILRMQVVIFGHCCPYWAATMKDSRKHHQWSVVKFPDLGCNFGGKFSSFSHAHACEGRSKFPVKILHLALKNCLLGAELRWVRMSHFHQANSFASYTLSWNENSVQKASIHLRILHEKKPWHQQIDPAGAMNANLIQLVTLDRSRIFLLEMEITRCTWAVQL